jgi:hypothetical protein
MYEGLKATLAREIAEREARLARLEQMELERLAREAKYEALRDAGDGTVIVFEYKFTTHGPIYSYAALCYAGRWNTTGPRSPKALTFEELCAWFNNSVNDVVVYVVTEIEELDPA